MRLGVLSLACQEKFIVEAKTEGPMALRVKYKIADVEEAQTIAKELGILIGYNAISPLTITGLMDNSDKMSTWMRNNDFTTIAAYAAAYQNNGNLLNGACGEFMKPINHKRITANATQNKYYNPIVFEYLWRAIGAFSKDRSKYENIKGPISSFIENFVTSGNDTDEGGFMICYYRLNEAAGFKPYTGDLKDSLLPSAKQCVLFNKAWKHHTT